MTALRFITRRARAATRRIRHTWLFCPWERFLAGLSPGEREALMARLPGSRYSIDRNIRMWIVEVSATIDVRHTRGLGGAAQAEIELYDFQGAIANRKNLASDLADTIPDDLRRRVEDWLASGPDARFLKLTELDTDHLLTRSFSVFSITGAPWDTRVPRDGLIRALVEENARRLEHTPDQIG